MNTTTQSVTVSNLLYDKTIDIHFNNRNHTYSVDGYEVPSVTEITGLLDKSKILIPWALDRCGSAFESLLPNVPFLGTADNMRDNVSKLMRTCLKAPDMQKAIGGKIGKLAHQFFVSYTHRQIPFDTFCLDVTATDSLSEPEEAILKRICRSFERWFDSQHLTPITSERVIFSKKHKFAGMFDGLLKDDTGKTWVVEYKTTKEIYVEHLLQASAYLTALEEEFDTRFAGALIVLFAKDGSSAIHRLQRKDVTACFKLFKHLLWVWRGLIPLEQLAKSSKQQ